MTVHFSDLKRIALSPAHYRAGLLSPPDPIPSMRIGTAMHLELLGPSAGRPVVVYPGAARRGREWLAFRASHPAPTEIISRSEWEAGAALAGAVRDDPVAMSLVDAPGVRREVPLTWFEGPIEMSTTGIDLVGDRWIADLKAARSAEPSAFARQAAQLSYHVQLAAYAHAARQNGIQVDRVYLIAVELSPPHPVTVHRLSPAFLSLGERTLALWCERLQACLEADHWPGYSQAILDMHPPVWMDHGDDDDEDEGDA